ncbi:zinc finger protein weckle [Drosophila bipectinata]|uniref:zinc finger protein weckle n=1 Tax=Drosophila bipectinata TaxID=42026 RepID=UPI001C899A91|nr:zinc finger protein weckle [Drosophila bipectinata]
MRLGLGNEWLYWCRLCARDDPEVDLHDDSQDEDFVRTVSKCFDVEMLLEEPELGSMLCKTCHALVSQLISFSESVNKVQAIFELLRHTEPHDSINIAALRQEYGLPVSCKLEDDYLENNLNIPQEDGESQIPLKCSIGRIRPVDKFGNKLYSKKKILIGIDSSSSSAQQSKNPQGRPKEKTFPKHFVEPGPKEEFKDNIHGGLRLFVCDCCGKQLKTFSSLVEHKLVHTDEKPCICTICNAGFKNKARLKVHIQTHGEPSFVCNICGKKLQTRAILNKHKYVHIEERRFKCDICYTGCKNSTAMKIHLLGHIGLRPYVCEYCGKSFASNTNCRSHKWKKHSAEAALEDENKSSRVPVPTLEELRAITREIAKSKKA